jgi:hypothetical protein
MEQYYRDIDRDWQNTQNKIEEWRLVPESTILYDDVLLAFHEMQRRGRMTPLIRNEYNKVTQQEQQERFNQPSTSNVYIQPVPEIKYQTSRPLDDREADLLQLTLRLIPATYHPVVMSYETVALAVLTWLTSTDLEAFLKWCTSNVCPCCLERIMVMWNDMFVKDIERLVNELKTMTGPMCGKQKAHYVKLIGGLVKRGKLSALVKTRITLCNEILFLGIKIKG